MRKHGFTLIELLIVVAIIAILAAVAVPNFLEAQTRSKVSRVKADMRTTAMALETYAVDNNAYPPPFQYEPPTPFTIVEPSEEAFEGFISFRLTSPIAYITALPVDVFGVTNPDEHPKNVSFHYSEQANNNRPAINEPDFLNDLAQETGFGPGGFRWMVFSHGPDLEHQDGATPESTPVQYDSTNGTISKGDIYYFGPGRGFR